MTFFLIIHLYQQNEQTRLIIHLYFSPLIASKIDMDNIDDTLNPILCKVSIIDLGQSESFSNKITDNSIKN